MTALISTGDYQLFTGDLTPSALAVTGAIAIASQLADEHCHRHFTYGQYTDTLPVVNGRVYPKAAPIASVSAPSGADIDGFAVTGVSGDVSLNDAFFSNARSPYATVTYYGGYQPYGTTGGVTPALPAKVARAIAMIAYNLLHPVVLAGVPSGSTSASVGDVAVSSSTGRDLSGMSDAVDAGAARQLFGYVIRRKPA